MASEPDQIAFTGVVTKSQKEFGMVRDDVFFVKSVVKGPFPQVGDRVLVQAEKATGMPFKYVAKRLQCLSKNFALASDTITNKIVTTSEFWGGTRTQQNTPTANENVFSQASPTVLSNSDKRSLSPIEGHSTLKSEYKAFESFLNSIGLDLDNDRHIIPSDISNCNSKFSEDISALEYRESNPLASERLPVIGQLPESPHGNWQFNNNNGITNPIQGRISQILGNEKHERRYLQGETKTPSEVFKKLKEDLSQLYCNKYGQEQCFTCGSVYHLVKNCPRGQKKSIYERRQQDAIERFEENPVVNSFSDGKLSSSSREATKKYEQIENLHIVPDDSESDSDSGDCNSSPSSSRRPQNNSFNIDLRSCEDEDEKNVSTTHQALSTRIPNSSKTSTAFNLYAKNKLYNAQRDNHICTFVNDECKECTKIFRANNSNQAARKLEAKELGLPPPISKRNRGRKALMGFQAREAEYFENRKPFSQENSVMNNLTNSLSSSSRTEIGSQEKDRFENYTIDESDLEELEESLQIAEGNQEKQTTDCQSIDSYPKSKSHHLSLLKKATSHMKDEPRLDLVSKIHLFTSLYDFAESLALQKYVSIEEILTNEQICTLILNPPTSAETVRKRYPATTSWAPYSVEALLWELHKTRPQSTTFSSEDDNDSENNDAYSNEISCHTEDSCEYLPQTTLGAKSIIEDEMESRKDDSLSHSLYNSDKVADSMDFEENSQSSSLFNSTIPIESVTETETTPTCSPVSASNSNPQVRSNVGFCSNRSQIVNSEQSSQQIQRIHVNPTVITIESSSEESSSADHQQCLPLKTSFSFSHPKRNYKNFKHKCEMVDRKCVICKTSYRARKNHRMLANRKQKKLEAKELGLPLPKYKKNRGVKSPARSLARAAAHYAKLGLPFNPNK